jgi:sugar phosphate isomerase/epimerase
MVMPQIYGLFHRHFDGDEALLRLARQRFEELDIAAELHPNNVEHALAEWPLAPGDGILHFAHLPRHLDVLSSQHRDEISRFVSHLSGRARGVVVHDHRSWLDRPSDVVAALRKIDKFLAATPQAPAVFVEYAADLPLDWFVALAEDIRELGRVHICVDTGHVVLHGTKAQFGRLRPGVDLWSLARDGERARAWLVDLEHAIELGIRDLLAVIRRIVALGQPVHFHLHDAHPLSLLSRYGVSDHLSFLQAIPVPSVVYRAGVVPGVLGPRGLSEILRPLTAESVSQRVTLTLEIHPTNEGQREPLGPHQELFGHWTDLAHAELSNAWFSTLAANTVLLRETWAKLQPREVGPTGPIAEPLR